MTKLMVEDFSWIYSVLVLDSYTKKIIGYYAGCNAALGSGSLRSGSLPAHSV